MFAVTYSTQAILPEIGRTFGVSPAEAGLSTYFSSDAFLAPDSIGLRAAFSIDECPCVEV